MDNSFLSVQAKFCRVNGSSLYPKLIPEQIIFQIICLILSIISFSKWSLKSYSGIAQDGCFYIINRFNLLGYWVIQCQIIQYFWILTLLPLRFCSFFSLFVGNVEMINP